MRKRFRRCTFQKISARQSSGLSPTSEESLRFDLRDGLVFPPRSEDGGLLYKTISQLSLNNQPNNKTNGCGDTQELLESHRRKC